MATPVIMPRQGQSVESCIISKWNKNPGDPVAVGDVLFSYETDKAAFEEEAKTDGILLGIFFEEGDDVPCLTNVCVIGAEGEDFEAFRPDETAAGSPQAAQGSAASGKMEVDPQAASVADASASAASVADASAAAGVQAHGISPRARNLAAQEGVDARNAVPSGPHDRIIEKDVRDLLAKGGGSTRTAYAEMIKGDPAAGITGTGIGGRILRADLAMQHQQPAAGAGSRVEDSGLKTGTVAAEYEEIKIPNIRKVIAKAMHASLTSMAQLTLNSSFDAGILQDFRAELKQNASSLGLNNITLNDMILFAVSRVLAAHPTVNAHYLDDRMLLFRDVHLGIAVDTPRGLMVPTIRSANRLSLNELAGQVKKLASECQNGTIQPDLLKGGSFTVTNLGALGIESFTPVINPPQTAILGVNAIIQKPREKNGVISLYPSMGLSLTFDHRALDGAPAARFLKDLGKALESFTLLLANS
ncbi:MAG TPA: 2-oxo acid dehydrogenase subunit E2 [Clostridiales bacterium]|nr:2-oxo acid dehydrogenase subunit E2 [Clostridiales bacterium]